MVERRTCAPAPAEESRVPPAAVMNREQFLHFCRLNRDARIERDAEGGVAVMAPTSGETGARSGRVFAAVFRWAEDDGSGVAFDSSTGFELPSGAVRSPDAAWVVRSRLAELPAEDRQGFLPLCPDFVVELLSPSDSLAVLRRKMEEYRQNGARLGWLIDPLRREVTIYRADGSLDQRAGSGVVSGEAVLPGFALDLSAVWKPAF